jgi:hypothetical protein
MNGDSHHITARQFRALQKRFSNRVRIDLDTFEQLPEGWCIFPLNPIRVGDVLKNLRLKPGIVFRAYQFKSGGNGNGFVYALPFDSDFPDPAERPRTKCVANGLEFDAPCPPYALPNFIEAFDGDRSPQSFFEASVLIRELEELGAMWHGGGWSTHMVLDADPFVLQGKTQGRVNKEINTPTEDWTWLSGKPNDWRPRVEIQGKESLVRFYSFSGLGQEVIYEHLDRYSQGNYVPERSVTEVAHGAGGYIF